MFDQDLFMVKSLLVINNKASKNILVYVAMLNGLGNVRRRLLRHSDSSVDPGTGSERDITKAAAES